MLPSQNGSIGRDCERVKIAVSPFRSRFETGRNRQKAVGNSSEPALGTYFACVCASNRVTLDRQYQRTGSRPSLVYVLGDKCFWATGSERA